MAQKRNKLLLTLSAAGLVAGISSGDANATATYDSFGEFFTYTAASFSNDVQAKIEFLREFPASPAAQRMANQLARTIESMPPAQRQEVMDRIAATGGLSGNFASIGTLENLTTASVSRVGPPSRPRGLDVARANTPSVTNSSIY